MKRDVTVVIPSLPQRHMRLSNAVQSVAIQEQPAEAIVVQFDLNREGAATTRNKALEKVNTTWVAFLDDDDVFYPHHLRVCLDAAEESGADLVYPYADFKGNDPLATVHNGQIVSPFGVSFGPEQEQYIRNRGNFIPVTHLVKTELVKLVGGFPQQNGFAARVSRDCEDYGLLLALLDIGAKFHHAPHVTWIYNFWSGNTGGRPA